METEKPIPGDEGGDAFARNSDPETSHEAAAHVRGKRAAILEARICEALERFPDGLVSSELADEIGAPIQSITPRMPKLRRTRRVVDSGFRRRPPSHKTSQTVWKLHPNYERPTNAT